VDPSEAAVLAIEASARAGELALGTRAGRVVTRALDPGASHGRDLMPTAAALVAEAGLTARDLDAVVVGRGPGSYTGLRVAAATALGLARGTEATLVGVPSFEAIAFAGLRAGERGAVVRDAFGGEGYAAVYERGAAEALTALEAPFCAPIAELAARLSDVDVALGDAAFCERVSATLAATHRDAPLGAVALLELGLGRLESSRDVGAEAIRPLYLREFEVKVRRRT